jgi:hypothetical protein
MLPSNESPCISKKKNCISIRPIGRSIYRVYLQPNDQSRPVVLEEDQVYSRNTESTAHELQIASQVALTNFL